jgi:S-adenosylmethionine:tRNA ribosyltransferase-isomerase
VRIEELDYEYPKELIALDPASPRDSAKLLVFENNQISHSDFSHLSDFLTSNDVLVFNETKVFPARIFGEKNGHKIEIVFLNEVSPRIWEVIVGGRLSDGENVSLPAEVEAKIKKTNDKFLAEVGLDKNDLFSYLEKHGHTPLPPYIKRKDNQRDRKEYQTVFAHEKGSAAAPTAGLHFTNSLIKKLKAKGVQIEYITLHVGLGTFAPVRTEKVENHPIHTEYFEINPETAQKLTQAKKSGKRIIACGTTTVRALESSFGEGEVAAQKSATSLFIYPGYKFQFVDGIITNFHTPRSSLLALVYAFSGQENVRKIYQEAIEKQYRLFSYGDGMLLL